jgi:ribosomal-protein-alanine N-acetyltransferase
VSRQIPLETPRLLLRNLVEADAPALFALYSDAETMRYWSCPEYHDPAQALALIRSIGQAVAEGSLLEWGVVSRDGDRLVGTLTLHQLDPGNRRAELGFLLGRPWWGRGLMREAAQAALAFAFDPDGLDLHRLEADTDPRNQASIRLLERLGFVREGLLRQRWCVAGEWSDSALFGLLAPDWRAAGGRG